MSMMMIQHLLVAVLVLLMHPACSFVPPRGVSHYEWRNRNPSGFLASRLLLALQQQERNYKLIATMGYGGGLKYTTNMNPILRLQIR
jgi:hypothetical protein